VQWFKTKGRHPIYAGNKSIPIGTAAHSVKSPLFPILPSDDEVAAPFAGVASSHKG
jgi:hypothetical protein